MKTLVVYFSRKGYVKKIAQQIASQNQADIFEIKTLEKTDGVLGFWWCGRFGMHRWGMPIEKTPDVTAFDKVIICSPVWVFSICAPVREFLKQNSGKIKEAQYVLVHFSNPLNYDKTVAEMDKLLNIKHSSYISKVCVWGKTLKTKEF